MSASVYGSHSILLEEMLAAETVGAAGLLTSLDRAWSHPLGPMLPVVQQPLPPGEVLLPLVRRRQVRIHERDDHVEELGEGLNSEARFVVIVRSSSR